MRVAIIGGGWLGLPLAKKLSQSGHQVVATKRSEKGVQSLLEVEVSAVQFNLGDSLDSPHLTDVFNAQLLIINIPPGRKSLQPDVFLQDMLNLINTAKQRGIEKLIFISTTSVYGESSKTVFEYTKVAPQTVSAKLHVTLEQHIRDLFKQHSVILRLAGLVSQDRHPARSLSAKKDIENGQKVVNLVHREDVISAIEKIITNDKFGHTYHLSSSEHPSRQQYYTDAATALELPAPEFAPSTSKDKGKVINCEFTLRELELNLQYPSPYDMIY